MQQSSNSKIGMMLLALVCLLSSMWELRSVSARTPAAHPLPPGSVWSDFTRANARWSPVKELLPPSTAVGYVSDATGDSLSREYNLAQTVLAPVIVVLGANQKYVIGCFHASDAAAKISKSRNLTLIKDFGNGVLLFKKTGLN
jgi:hypothetical protein